MKLEPSDIDGLKPVIEAVVAEVLAKVETDRQKLDGKLALAEPRAAALIDVAPHVLRDARLRGEITGSRVGKRILYSRDELVKFLGRNQT